jgi:hypothetical protein
MLGKKNYIGALSKSGTDRVAQWQDRAPVASGVPGSNVIERSRFSPEAPVSSYITLEISQYVWLPGKTKI